MAGKEKNNMKPVLSHFLFWDCDENKIDYDKYEQSEKKD
jgi:hypothetical protein